MNVSAFQELDSEDGSIDIVLLLEDKMSETSAEDIYNDKFNEQRALKKYWNIL